MSKSFFLPEPEHFTTGTVGPPGGRTFYLQAAGEGRLVSLKVEKQQVAALAEYLGGVLADLPEPDAPLPPAPQLIEPVAPDWTVGGIGIAVDEEADRILLVVHELVTESSSADEEAEVAELLAELAGLETGDDDPFDDDDDDDPFDEDDGAIVRLRLTRTQVAAFIERAGELIAAGRPLCPFCGLPSDPSGHICPRAN